MWSYKHWVETPYSSSEQRKGLGQGAKDSAVELLDRKMPEIF
jgi:hypothetical protein